MIRRVPIGRVTALTAVLVGTVFALHGHGRPHFRTLKPGVEFAMIRGEPYCRRGSSHIAVVRFDPARTRLVTHHYTREPEKKPLDILEWQRRTRAIAVFNAGQYYPDYSYMGLLVSEGAVVSRKLHPTFKAVLVADPVGTGPRARVIDLGHERIDPAAPGWRQVAQSFMLFDHTGTLRIKKTAQVANRTAVAQDQEGRLLVFTTEGGYTLHDFARLLRDEPFHLSHAMSMDGGDEAELCVKSGDFRYASFGSWEEGPGAAEAAAAMVPLPAVITIEAP